MSKKIKFLSDITNSKSKNKKIKENIENIEITKEEDLVSLNLDPKVEIEFNKENIYNDFSDLDNFFKDSSSLEETDVNLEIYEDLKLEMNNINKFN